MKTADQYNPTVAFGLLLQGPPKTNKTTIALQFPKPYVLDADNNLYGPLNWIREHKPQILPNIRYDTVNAFDDGRVVPPEARWARTIQLLNVAIKDPSVETLVVDGLASISDYVVDHILNEKPSGKEKERMTIGDWIPFRNMISKLVVHTRATGKRLVMTAHDEYNKNELDGSIIVTPNMPSKLAHNIGGFFSDVWHTEPEVVDGKLIVKVRALPRPTIPSIGNSLGLPAEFVFDMAGLVARLEKYKSQPVSFNA